MMTTPHDAATVERLVGIARRYAASEQDNHRAVRLLLLAAQAEVGVELPYGDGEALVESARIIMAKARGTGGTGRRVLRVLTDEEVEQLPPPEWLIDGIIPQGSLGVLFSPPGRGKTFTALSMALSVSTGRPWLGHSVVRGPAAYTAAEGTGGLGIRLRAWKESECFVGSAGVVFIPEAVNLLDGGVTLLLDALDARGVAPRLVVLDTLARMMVGGEENSAKDVGLAVDAVARIQDATGAACLLLHHTSMAGERERGSTALRGAADVMMALKGNGVLTLECEKMKDGPAFDPVVFELSKFGGSMAPVTAKSGWQLSGLTLNPAERETLVSLSTAFLDGGATATAWMAATNVPERSFYRARTSLVRAGYVIAPKSERGGHYTLTDTGNAAVTAILPITAKSLPDSDTASLHVKAPTLKGADSGSDSKEAA
jgi:hypothetical protein